MKHIKRTLALLLAVVLVLALSVCAFAAEDYSITVKNTNTAVSINGNTYSAYKIFDATYSGTSVAYTVSEEFKDFSYPDKNGTSLSGDALIAYLGTLTNNSDALNAFAKAALAYASAQNIQPAGTATAANETAVIDLSAPGYYLVTGTATAAGGEEVTAACSLTTAKPTAESEPKVDAPSIDKKIVEGDKKVEANTASIGDAVNYEITSKVPSMQGYTKYYFVIEDTLSKGLTFNDDLAVTIDGKTLTKDTDYTLTVTTNSDGTTSLEIVFKNFIQYKEQAGKDIIVTYSATLNQDAELSPSVGNPNTVKLIYSNNPNATGEGIDKPNTTDPVGETPESKTKTYVTGVKLTKVDSTDNKTLTGAKFKITGTGMKVVLVNKTIYKASENGTFYMLKDGSYTGERPTEATKDKYDSTTQKYEKVTVVDKTTVPTDINATGYVDKDGVLTFEGLGEGEYEITEIIAPQGYNLLKDPIKLVITADAKFDKCTWTVTADGKELIAGDDNLYALTVENSSGTELPSTGGIGTTIFYIVGSLLAVCAVILLVTKKRMGKAED